MINYNLLRTSFDLGRVVTPSRNARFNINVPFDIKKQKFHKKFNITSSTFFVASRCNEYCHR